MAAQKVVASMKRIAVLLALAAMLPMAPTAARAQIAAGGGPIDVTANELEMIDTQKVAIWRGKVEALQGANRMLADQLNVYFSGKSGAAPAAGADSPGRNWGEVQRLVATGNVFFISPQQTARGENAVYEVVPDTVTLTGNVIIVAGENVVKGDKVVIEVKTGHATIVSNAQGRNKAERVRGVFYSGSDAAGAAPAKPAAPAAAPAPTPAPAPAASR